MPALAPPPATVRTRDDLALILRHWPVAGEPRGRILLVHGLGEHVGRYELIASRLVARGWDVVGYDHRGHGRSPGRRGVIARADDLLADCASVAEVVRPPEGVPFVLLGNSMGGLVAAQCVAESRVRVDALVLSSPALDASLSALQRLQLAVGLALVPDVAMGNQLDTMRLSHDPEVVRRYQADPLVHDRITARLAKALLDGGALVRAHAASWRVPTLLLYAGDDHLVSPAGSAAFAAAAPRDVVTAQRFEGLYHEIMNEPAADAAPVFAALDAWLDVRRTR